MDKTNGICKYLNNLSENETEKRCRITKKRIYCESKIWDKSGKRVDDSFFGRKVFQLISYQVDGEGAVFIK